jgi:hypothetical protein
MKTGLRANDNDWGKVRPPPASARSVQYVQAPVLGMARKAPGRADIHRPKRFQGRDAIDARATQGRVHVVERLKMRALNVRASMSLRLPGMAP